MTNVDTRPPHLTSKSVLVEENIDIWLGMPVTKYTGGLGTLSSALPAFERRPFAMAARGGRVGRANAYYDAIVRLPMTASDAEIPVGIVSRTYQLIQHREVIERVAKTLSEVDVCVDDTRASVCITPHGERMQLTVVLPEESRFCYQLGDGDSMQCRIECFNSVDGSTRLMVVMGWLRFVCQNGLVVGRVLAYAKRAHREQLDFDDVVAGLRKGIQQVASDRERCDEWRALPIRAPVFERWVDGPLKQRWGMKAAARAYAICQSGRDLRLTDPFEKSPASQRRGILGDAVPGAPRQSGSVFDVAQALSWLAGQRRDLAARVDATQDIPQLIGILVRKLSPRNMKTRAPI